MLFTTLHLLLANATLYYPNYHFSDFFFEEKFVAGYFANVFGTHDRHREIGDQGHGYGCVLGVFAEIWV